MTSVVKMSNEEFRKMSSMIYSDYGIKMPPSKKTLLECRLQKRLNALNIYSFKEYCDFVFSPEGQRTELIQMIDVVTTNKTDFFRESIHFDFLSNHCFPAMTMGRDGGRPLRIWSAGCSSGEEPYTIAMVASEFAENRPFNFSIFGTDLSTEILKKAALAIYSEKTTSVIPMVLKRKYFLRGKDDKNKTYKIVPELRQKLSLQRLNFMDHIYNVPYNFDIIFCRNVLIYFDKETQEKVINRLCDKLNKGGIFFLGHSESITDMNVPLQLIKPTIFRRI